MKCRQEYPRSGRSFGLSPARSRWQCREPRRRLRYSECQGVKTTVQRGLVEPVLEPYSRYHVFGPDLSKPTKTHENPDPHPTQTILREKIKAQKKRTSKFLKVISDVLHSRDSFENPQIDREVNTVI